MKRIARVSMLLGILPLVFLFFIIISNSYDKITRIQESYLSARILFSTLGVIGSFSIFFLWGLMFYHCCKHVFKTSGYKVFWLFLMSMGLFVGSWFYYVMVFEMGNTLVSTKDK
jgi:hypothetical protein